MKVIRVPADSLTSTIAGKGRGTIAGATTNAIAGDTTDAIDRRASEWCSERVVLGARTLFVPAGQTPVGLYRLWEETRPDFLKSVKLVQIDDVATGRKTGLFKRFFETHLPSYLSNFEFIELATRSADVGVLGLGLNGHVAFHEPHLPRSFFSGCVRLDAITCRNLDLEPGTWGVSFGAGAFMQCRSLLIVVKGASKREVLARLIAKDESLTATSLMAHPDVTILADTEALPGDVVSSNL